ncbi:MAG TPA: hypothetical protein VIO58_03310 [Candidatus Methanoperedens sp.]
MLSDKNSSQSRIDQLDDEAGGAGGTGGTDLIDGTGGTGGHEETFGAGGTSPPVAPRINATARPDLSLKKPQSNRPI